MSKIIWYLIIQIICFLLPMIALSQNLTLNFGIRTSVGICSFQDEKSKNAFNYKPGYSIGFILDNPGKKISVLNELNIGIKGAYNNQTESRINLNYLNAIQLAGRNLRNTKTRISAGIYESLLLKQEINSGYNGYPFRFNDFDFGLLLRPSQIVYATSKVTLLLDSECSYSLISIYNNDREITLSSPESKWTRNISFSIGINLIFANLP